MCSKRNGAAGVRCHRAMNWPIPVASTRLWASCEPLRRHVLKIAIYLSGCISVWNPSKPPRRSSLRDPYLSLFFLPFLWFIPKITQPTSIARNYILKHNFFSKKILYCFRYYLVAAWFSHALITTLSCALSQVNFCCV
jgi:hypothetical protein